ncbi:MAG TPA: PadR family transcriptional regulator [Rubrobacteraceae bacterium]|jgi:DNA-binding PadR family transcriptional regulator|nr:PadR family transcriptional regulator [Rubrobacteraceae bacterium]
MHHHDAGYIEKLLQGWEEVHKKGQLTFWILLALKDGPKHMAGIKSFIDEATNHAFTVDDQSMYRALRRYYETELADYEAAPGHGPDRKVYRLSPIGEDVLRQFARRNIVDTLYKPAIKSLIERTVR